MVLSWDPTRILKDHGPVPYGHDASSQPDSGYRRSVLVDGRSVPYDPFGRYEQEQPKPAERTVIRLSSSIYIGKSPDHPKTGRYFAGTSGSHVWEGKDLDDLARKMASVDGDAFLDLSNTVIKPGCTRVRSGRGKKYIKGTYPAVGDCQELLELIPRYRSEALAAKRRRIEETAAVTAKNNADAAERNDALLRSRGIEPHHPAEEERPYAQVRHHGWTGDIPWGRSMSDIHW